MSEKDNRLELSAEDLEKVAGGGNVEGGHCAYCHGSDMNGQMVSIIKDGQQVYTLKITCNNPHCPTNNKFSPFYGRSPLSQPSLIPNIFPRKN